MPLASVGIDPHFDLAVPDEEAALTLAELVDEYLAQHDGEPETIEKLS